MLWSTCEMRPVAIAAKLRLCKTVEWEDAMWAGVWASLLGEGVPLHWDRGKWDWEEPFRQSMGSRRDGVWCKPSEVVSIGTALVPAGSPALMLRDRGKGTSQFLCSQKGLSMNAASLEHVPKWANNFPTVCPRNFSDHGFHIVYPQAVCLPSLQEQCNALGALFQPSPLQALSPTGCQKSQNLAHLAFQANWYGDSFSLCTSLCADLSLTLFHNHSSLTTVATTISFS